MWNVAAGIQLPCVHLWKAGHQKDKPAAAAAAVLFCRLQLLLLPHGLPSTTRQPHSPSQRAQ